MKTTLKKFTMLMLSLAIVMGVVAVFGGDVLAKTTTLKQSDLTATVGTEFSLTIPIEDKSGIRKGYITTEIIEKGQPPQKDDILTEYGLRMEGGKKGSDPAIVNEVVNVTVTGTPTKAGELSFYVYGLDGLGNKTYYPIKITISEPEKPITPTELTPTTTTLKESFSIIFNPAGGRWEDGSTDPIVIDCKQGDVITILAAPRKAGANFLYWEGSRYYPGEEYVVEGDHTFTARYDDLPEVDTYLLFEAVNGTPATQPTLTTISTMPAETIPAPSPSQSASVQNLPKTGEKAAGMSLSVMSALTGLGLFIAMRKKIGK